MRPEPRKEYAEMSNVAVVTGALVAGIVGGTLFAAGIVAYPRSAAPNPAVTQAGPPMGAIITGPSGAAMVMPPGYGPGVMMTSGEPTTPATRQSADGLVPLTQPQSAASIPVRDPTLVRYELETRE